MKNILPLLFGAALLPMAVQATSTSNIVGYTTESLPGKALPSDPDLFLMMGTTLHNPVLVAGDLEVVAVSSVSDTDVDFTTVLGSGTYILEITSGTGIGTLQEFTTYTATDITGIQDLTGSVTAGDTYRVREASTVEGIFGDASAPSLNAGSVTTADVVWVPDGVSFNRYYVDEGIPVVIPPAWVKIGGGGDGTDPIIYADGVFVQRRTTGDIDLVVSGELKTDETLVPVFGGGLFNYHSSIYPVDLTTGSTTSSESTVASLGLDSLMVANNDPGLADILWLPNGIGGWDRYFNSEGIPVVIPGTFDQIGGSTGIDPATVEVPSAFIVQRRAPGNVNHTLDVPPGYSSL